jgi:hypothetical protein
MIKFLFGFLLASILALGVSPHAEGMLDQLEYEVCYHYGLCYGYEWVNCDKNGHNCDMDEMWVIYKDHEQIPLRFLGVERAK